MDMRTCIDNCTNCHRICLESAGYGFAKTGRHMEHAHIRLLLDCAQICATSADFMLRGSDLHMITCGACAEICERCAAACEAMGDDEQMRRCAEACRRCVQSCREMSRMAA